MLVILNFLSLLIVAFGHPQTLVQEAFATESSEITTNFCEVGVCVPYYLCSQNGTLLTQGEGLVEVKINVDEAKIDENLSYVEKNRCSSVFETCCSLEAPVITEPPRPIDQDITGCGFRNVDGVGFRMTASKPNEAQFGEFPWTVAILKEAKIDEYSNEEKIVNVFVCGGSLIDPSVVLTAAHCINTTTPPTELKIRAGEWDTHTKDEIFPDQERAVRDYVIHPKYYHGAVLNDVALLFLTQPVEIAENVNTVCLPNADDVFDHARCFSSGWGKDKFGKDAKYSVILKRIELPIIPRESCVDKLRKTRLGTHFNLHESFLCAGGEGFDTHKGDGGGPLVCPIQNARGRYAQAGIVSWGIQIREGTAPGVYVNVAMFREWIDKKMALNNLTSNWYSP